MLLFQFCYYLQISKKFAPCMKHFCKQIDWNDRLRWGNNDIFVGFKPSPVLVKSTNNFLQSFSNILQETISTFYKLNFTDYILCITINLDSNRWHKAIRKSFSSCTYDPAPSWKNKISWLSSSRLYWWTLILFHFHKDY